MRNITISFFFVITVVFGVPVLSQQVGSKVSLVAVDGKTYAGTIKEIQGSQYKVKYDGYDFESWLTSNQFTVSNTNPTDYNTQADILIGARVSFPGTDGKTYTAVITDKQGNNYKVKYDGYDFTTWITKEQFTVVSTGTTYTQPQQQTTTTGPQCNSSSTAGNQDILSIFNFGKKQGWVSVVQESKLNSYLAPLSQQDKNKLVQFINQAKTNSAKFFVLKSWLAGDRLDSLKKFINQLNQYPESYQQERCLVTTRHSIIQQWQQTCSVTTIQTFLADLCPRYAWEVKQIANYDAVANDPNHPMAVQQRELLEKYGGIVSARGTSTGKEITLNEPLNDFVGKILGVQFTWQQITEPLPSAFTKVRAQLDRGIDVPLNIKFVGTEARHFILVMKYRNTGSGYQYLIYDPWDGVCDYVSESNLVQGSLAPLNKQWRIRVDYYYPAM